MLHIRRNHEAQLSVEIRFDPGVPGIERGDSRSSRLSSTPQQMSIRLPSLQRRPLQIGRDLFAETFKGGVHFPRPVQSGFHMGQDIFSS
jgi:hypothetical protein